MWWIRGLQIDKELESLNGWLYPANEHVNLPCQGKHNVDDELVVMSGNSGFVVNNFPHTVLAWKCEPIMTVDRDANGSVGITLTILDQDGKVVVALSKGHFDVNRNKKSCICTWPTGILFSSERYSITGDCKFKLMKSIRSATTIEFVSGGALASWGVSDLDRALYRNGAFIPMIDVF